MSMNWLRHQLYKSKVYFLETVCTDGPLYTGFNTGLLIPLGKPPCFEKNLKLT